MIGKSKTRSHKKPGLVELSVVIPCRNEELAIEECIRRVKEVFKKNHINGEIIIVDNASSDNSRSIAESEGAIVVEEKRIGYGYALKKGFSIAKGSYVIIGDADCSYDFLEIPRLFSELKKGYEMVIGNRFKGNIKPGAMPFLHRYVGNPMISFLIRRLFRVNVYDTQSGFRGFSKDALKKLNLRQNDMSIASEMIIKAAKLKLKIKEVPINYYKRVGESKLKTLKHGWAHIKFIIKSYIKDN